MTETLKAKSLSHSHAACTGPLDPEGKFQPLLPTVCLQIQPSRDRSPPPDNMAPSVHQRLAGRFGGKFEAGGWLCGARRQSRCTGALIGTWMEDTGGKSARRPGRHLQVEASGSGNAAGVRQRLVGRFRGGERRACMHTPGGRSACSRGSQRAPWVVASRKHCAGPRRALWRCPAEASSRNEG